MKKVKITGDIVDNSTARFYQWFGMDATSPAEIDGILNDGNIDPVEVVINSGGGDVFAGSEIYSMLRSYAGNVTVNIMGIAASAASVIAMAGNTVNMSPTAQMMIHKAWSYQQGNADDHNHEAQVLSSIDDSLVNAYVAKTGINRADILQMMQNETWMTAQNAVDKGFADNIMFQDDKQLQIANSLGHTLPKKDAVKKFMTMITEFKDSEKPTSVIKNQTIDNEERSTPSLRDQKLAILFGKEDEKNGN
ncbi:head maturation protease, ClpP-related [Limosilactobacillus reuteri]|jgi:Protease subunit of ATP-dependent Clp proteases|uniref:head maturation protease, ClpP-related n=1 Tax=Limosilactobacillus reuteri TaxID=1598 RepID=UPI001E3697F8|nr:head maturation protease, ClpP-related [Limosilactobacillus reuteri]MCC4486304.1 Clp protease ClpP [Limosilactobacillus reuteri]